jgi:outer membrane receptor for ferrienterochelin and colicin
VLINDRPTQLTGDDLISYLKTLKSDEIKKIEVITNPPSKYTAEGNSGVLNIITKNAKKNTFVGFAICNIYVW